MTPRQTVRRVKLDDLTSDPDNVRVHDSRNLEAITASLDRFGQVKPIVVTTEGLVVAGNGTLEAARTLGWSHLNTVLINETDPDTLRAYSIADNRTAELATWDNALLGLQLHALSAELLTATGFDPDDMPPTFGLPPDDDAEGSREELTPREASMLALVNVTTAEPDHVVETGGVYLLSGRHRLIVVAVFDGWPTYAPYLLPGSLLLPFPEPYVTLTPRALISDLVMVQPSKYLAGHLLDKHAYAYGEDAVSREA